MAYTRLVILKLGGSVITHKESESPSADRDNVRRMSKEIAGAIRLNASDRGERLRLVIVHGAGSYGHPIVTRSKIDRGIATDERTGGLDAGQLLDLARTQRQMNELNALVTEALIENGVPAFCCQPSSFAVMSGKKLPMESRPAPDARPVIASFPILAVAGLVSLGMVPVLFGVPAIRQSS